MRDNEIRIGDCLRIRDWDDMAIEFGVDASGSIKCDASFVQSMKHLCGMFFTIKRIRRSVIKGHNVYEPEEVGFGMWTITAHMLEPVEEEIIPERPEDLFGFLFQ